MKFLRTADCKPITIPDAIREKSLSIATIVSFMDELHPLVDSYVKNERERMRETKKKGSLANFSEGDFVLVAREDFFEGDQLGLRWRGTRRVIKALNDYVYRVEVLRNGSQDNVHASRLKLYSDKSLHEGRILSHVIDSETGMPVSRLLRLVEQDGSLWVLVRWKGLTKLDDTIEALMRVYEDVPRLLVKLLDRSNTPQDLRDKARAALGL